MIDISTNFFNAKNSHYIPVVICKISTQRTGYLFSRVFLNDDETGGIQGVGVWDGSVYTGDGGVFGGSPISQSESRVLQFGSVQKSLVTNAKDLPASLSQSQIGAYSITFDNSDGFFSRLLGDDQYEPLLGQSIEIILGFKGNSYNDLISIFRGEITQIVLDSKKVRITAEAVTTIYPAANTVPGLTVYAVRGDGATEMAEQQFTAIQSANFLASDTWLFTANIIKDDLADAGVIFEIENVMYSATVLQIGIDANNFPFVTVGTLVEAVFGTTTYTSTSALTAADIADTINLKVFFDTSVDIVYFTVNGVTTEIAVTDYYDRTGVSDNIFRFGNGFDGDIQNCIWNDTHYWVNNAGDNSLVSIPDVIGSLSTLLTDGTWVVWPSI